MPSSRLTSAVDFPPINTLQSRDNLLFAEMFPLHLRLLLVIINYTYRSYLVNELTSGGKVIQYIVESALKDHIKNKSSKQILEVKVCDPAMGSGHFLLGALNYLTEAFIETLYDEAEDDLTIKHIEAKRKVLDNCIFGVDINSRAVKLAKMSLWLETAHINKKLERLDDQIRTGDSLISFKWKTIEYTILQAK